MIRRWSCLINLNNNFDNFNNFKKNHKIKLFKSSVNFKRFSFKFTKLKRKSLIRFKHKTNWLIYTNIIKNWVSDYMFTKIYLRYQFLNKIYLNNFYFYNFNFIKNKNENFFYNFNFIFFNFTNKKLFYFFKNNTSFGNSPLSIAFFIEKPNLNNCVLPVYSSWNQIMYPYSTFLKENQNNSFSIDPIFEFFFDFFIKKSFEIKKIIILLYYINITKFKKLNKFVFKIL